MVKSKCLYWPENPKSVFLKCNFKVSNFNQALHEAMRLEIKSACLQAEAYLYLYPKLESSGIGGVSRHKPFVLNRHDVNVVKRQDYI